MSVRRARHFGPDRSFVGGMGSVIALLVEHRMGAEEVEATASWRPTARLASCRPACLAAWRLARESRDTVTHVHLAERGALLREGALVILSRLLGRATVATIHGSRFQAFAARHPHVTSFVLRRAHTITCLDDEVLSLLRRLAPRSRVELLPNPVAMNDRSGSARDTEEIVLFAGEIGLRKGADVLWRAWPTIAGLRPHARCVMVGPLNEVRVPHLERLEVREPVDAGTVQEMIRTARVIALPSRAEGMPMILTEAMAAGRPFVSTPVGGIAELARAGGRLVSVGDEPALAGALSELLADADLAASVGERGRELCRQTRAVEVIAARLGDLYAEALQRSVRRRPAR